MSGILTAIASIFGAPGVIAGAPSSDGAVSVDIQLKNDGTTAYTSSSVPQTGAWVAPSTSVVAAFYEVKVDVTGGSLTSGTTGSYVALSSNRTWSKVGSGTVTMTFTFREIATGIVRKVQTGVTIVVS